MKVLFYLFMCLNLIFPKYVIQMLFNNTIQITFLSTKFTFFKNIYIVVYIIEGNLWINFDIYHLDKLSTRYNL